MVSSSAPMLWRVPVLRALFAILGLHLCAFAAGQTADESPPEDPLAQILESLGLPFVPPGFRERFHVGRVQPPPVRADPPPAPGFMPAEWEPAVGVFVAWPRNLTDNLLTALAANVPLQVIADEGTEDEARNWFRDRLPESRFRILSAPKNSGYPRDIGPQLVFDSAGQPYLIEQPSRGGPQFGLETSLERRDEPTLTLYDPATLDERVAPAIARQLALPVLRFGGFLTGGNFLVDGLGGAFYSDAQLDENYPIMPPAEFESAISEYLGISRPGALENFAAFGIQHLDTWMKVLDPYRILVIRPPPGHPEEAPTERNLARLEKMRTFDGRRWEILRIDTPAVSRQREWPRHIGTAAYTNSLILNDTIYVPLYGIPEDDDALETWRRAMPGYEVLGFESEEWRTFDAIHCRTRALFDPDMLRITPLEVKQSAPGKLSIRARIVSYSGAELIPSELALHWRKSDAGSFHVSHLVPEGPEHVYGAAVPELRDGKRLQYYFTAADLSGRRISAPTVAPMGGPYIYTP